jgi:zinc transporter
MSQSEGLLWACMLNRKGGAIFGTIEEVEVQHKAGSPIWVHLNRLDPQSVAWIRERSGVDPIVADALLAEETRPRLQDDIHKSGYLLILRGVNLNSEEKPEDMVSIRIWVEKERIITIRSRRIKAAIDVKEKLEIDKGPVSINELVTAIVAQLTARMEPILGGLNDMIDEAEAEVVESPRASLRAKIIDIRKQAIMFKRYIAPQKDVIFRMTALGESWLEDSCRRRMVENFDRILRYVEDLDATRERSQIVQDELSNVLSDRLNKNMYLLSVIAAVFLPLGFLTGLFGVNVQGIPGAEDPQAFWIFCGILTMIIIAQIALFKKMRWF